MRDHAMVYQQSSPEVGRAVCICGHRSLWVAGRDEVLREMREHGDWVDERPDTERLRDMGSGVQGERDFDRIRDLSDDRTPAEVERDAMADAAAEIAEADEVAMIVLDDGTVGLRVKRRARPGLSSLHDPPGRINPPPPPEAME